MKATTKMVLAVAEELNVHLTDKEISKVKKIFNEKPQSIMMIIKTQIKK